MFSLASILGDVDAYTRNISNPSLPVAEGVIGLRSLIVNVYFVAIPSQGGDDEGFDETVTDGETEQETRRSGRQRWVLVDAGLPTSAAAIMGAAAELFGAESRPECILLTHGHVDHTGSLQTLLDEWDCQAFAHRLELPYLTGQASYPPADPWVGGGFSLATPLLPRGPFDFGARVQPLPADGRVPYLPDWRWVATPGHSPGHVSYFRDSDRTLIVGDAFATTKQESLMSVLTQAQGVFGPPAFFTSDWSAAERSVRLLSDLRPAVAAAGHGTPIAGERLSRQLDLLARDFVEQAVPADGRYTDNPVPADETGPLSIPPAKPVPKGFMVAAGALATVGLFGLTMLGTRGLFGGGRRNDE